MVPGGGVEPPRPCDRRILSPLRLPVPPSRLYKLTRATSAFSKPYQQPSANTDHTSEPSTQPEPAASSSFQYRIAHVHRQPSLAGSARATLRRERRLNLH